MTEPGGGDSNPNADPLNPIQGSEATRASIWPAIYPEVLKLVKEHTSTIVFVNNRRSAERIALRLNELANRELEDENGNLPEGVQPVELARAHHGSLAREERTKVEELLKSGGAAVPGRDLLAGAGDRHGGGRPRAADRVAEVGRPRAAADRTRGAWRGRGQPRADLPQVPRRPARVRGRRQAHARRRDRADRRAAKRARRARAAGRRDRRLRGRRRHRGRCAARARAAHPLLLGALARASRERARHARRPLPLAGVRRAARADRVGSPRRT